MCLIAFNWQNHPVYKMVLVANRDEYYMRPSSPVHIWEEGFYAGKDLKGGGTWMGMHPTGRFCALTNYREITNEKERSTSRGELVVNFLKGKMDTLDYLDKIQQCKHNFKGFSLLVSDGEKMYYLSNYQNDIQEVGSGYHGLSNALLDTPWPKVQSAKKGLSTYLQKTSTPDIDTVIDLLYSTTPAPSELLPNTGISAALEKSFSAQFIVGDEYYGTVNTTALFWSWEGEVIIREVRFIPDTVKTTVEFSVKSF